MTYYSFMVLCSCKLISQSANMGKTQEKKKKISQKSKDLNFINQMKISKNVKEELIRSTKSKKNGLNRSMNKKMVLKKK